MVDNGALIAAAGDPTPTQAELGVAKRLVDAPTHRWRGARGVAWACYQADGAPRSSKRPAVGADAAQLVANHRGRRARMFK